MHLGGYLVTLTMGNCISANQWCQHCKPLFLFYYEDIFISFYLIPYIYSPAPINHQVVRLVECMINYERNPESPRPSSNWLPSQLREVKWTEIEGNCSWAHSMLSKSANPRWRWDACTATDGPNNQKSSSSSDSGIYFQLHLYFIHFTQLGAQLNYQ